MIKIPNLKLVIKLEYQTTLVFKPEKKGGLREGFVMLKVQITYGI